jgi:hypothetical protein
MRLYLCGGVMVGFASHLILDEFYAIDFNGLRFKPNKFSGSAFKFASPSWPATLATYALLAVLGYFTWAGGVPEVHWPLQLPRPGANSGGPPHLSEP